VKKYSPGGANVITVYDAASNCLTAAYKQNRNNYYVLAMQQDKASVCMLATLRNGVCNWLTNGGNWNFQKKTSKKLGKFYIADLQRM